MHPFESVKICGVVPLRYGLITWAVVKAIVALCSLGYLSLCIYFLFIEHGVKYDVVLLGILIVLQVALLVDICMTISLIIGESKKSYKLVTAYFRYAIYAVIAAIVIITVYTAYELIVLYGAVDNAPWKELRSFNLADVVKLATIGTIYVVFEVFIVYLLRTEVNSLRSQQRQNCLDDLSMTETFID